MSRLACLYVLLAPLHATEAPPANESAIAVQHDITVKVIQPADVADRLIALAEEEQGYFSARDDHGVTLKVPRGRDPSIIAAAESAGVVVQRNYAATDLGPQLAEWRTLLGSRQSVLQRYFAVIGEASASNVVTVEREMTQLVQAIETLKGQIRLAEHQLAMAQITVRFEFRERRAPVRDGVSSFGWLNSVNMADLIGAFAYERKELFE